MGTRELQEFYASKEGIRVMWMGNDGWILNLRGLIVCTDPDFHTSGRVPLPADVDVEELAGKIKAVFITHEHGDHFNSDTCLFLQKRSDCAFVVPKSCINKARKIGLDDMRIVAASPDVPFSLLGLKVAPVRAVHGHYHGSVYRGASLEDCGYIIYSGDFSLYQPGDTTLLDEHLTMKDIDLLFFSPTEHNTHVENSLHMIRAIRPRYIIPQHYDSYVTTPENAFWTKGFPDEVCAKLNDEEKQKFVKLPQGQPFKAE